MAGEGRPACAPFPAWVSNSPSRCWPTGPSWAPWTVVRIAALVGVAPFNRDRGAMRGKRHVWGGRSRVRAVWYMGTLAATRCNPVIRDCYQRRLAAGKPKQLALVAGMRKLLVILNAMLQQRSSWQRSSWRDITPAIAVTSS